MRWASIAVPIVSLIISVTSLVFSLRPDSIEPKVAIQVSDYKEESFDVMVYNYGVTPTFLSWLHLEISLIQRDTEHSITAVFPLTEQLFLPAGESRTINMEYASHSFGKWTSTGGSDAFDLQFLYMSVQMGSNLFCQVDAGFTMSNNFDDKTLNPSVSHSACYNTIEWFAKEIGPLKARKSSD